MNEQCNTCGGFTHLAVCEHCSTVVCESCKPNHKYLCEELQKRKKRNLGPTVANVPVPQHRRGHETPPTTRPERPNWKPNQKPGETTKDGTVEWTNTGPAALDVNAELTAVKEMLEGE